jgi:sensor c-di-GMP phosphodiesterase-like protein
MEKTQKQAVHWADEGAKRANKVSRRMRDQLDAGTRNAVSVEESMVRHMRENPALYVIGAALLIGALIAKLILESRQNSETPLL